MGSVLGDDEREVDRGRMRVEGDKNGLRMGMWRSYPSLLLTDQLFLPHLYLYHNLVVVYTTCHSNQLEPNHPHIPILSLFHTLDHLPISSLIYTMVSLSRLHDLNALGRNALSPPNRLLRITNTPTTLLNRPYPFPHLSFLLNCLLSRDLPTSTLFEPFLSLLRLLFPNPHRSLYSFLLKQTP